MNENLRGNRINIRPAALFAAAVVCGTLSAFSVFVREMVFVPLIVAAAFASALFLFRKRKMRKAFLLSAIAAGLCLLGFLAFYAEYKTYYAEEPSFTEATVVLTAKGNARFSSGYASGSFYGEIIENGERKPLPKNVKAEFFVGEEEDLSEGSFFVLRGTLYSISPYYDGRTDASLISEGVGFGFRVKEVVSVGKNLPDFAGRFRNYVRETLAENASPRSAGVIRAMILGEKEGLSSERRNDYRVTGLAHLFSVSGLHVGFLAVICDFVGRRIFRRKRIVGKIVGIIILWAYVGICGFPSSAVRAAVMATTVIILRPKRRADAVSSLCTAAAVLFLISPSSLFSGGCLMSFSAVSGIISFSSLFSELFRKKVGNKRLKRVLTAFCVSLGASVGTFPFVWSYYGEISLLSLPVNMLAVAAMTAVFVLSAVFLIPPFTKLLALPSALAAAVDSAVSAAAESGAVSLPALSTDIAVFIGFAAILTLVGGKIRLSRKIKAAALSLCAATVVISSFLFPAIPNETAFFRRRGVSFMTSRGGEVFVFSDIKSEYDVYTLENALKRARNGKIHILVDSFPLSVSEEGLRKLRERLPTADFVSGDKRETDGRLLCERAGFSVAEEYSGEGVFVAATEINGRKCFLIQTEGRRFVFIRDAKNTDFSEPDGNFGRIDFVYAKRISGENADFGGVIFTDSTVRRGNCFSSAFDIDFTFYPSRGIIKGRKGFVYP